MLAIDFIDDFIIFKRSSPETLQVFKIPLIPRRVNRTFFISFYHEVHEVLTRYTIFLIFILEYGQLS